MKRNRLRVVETSVLAHQSSDTLYAYSDGSLPDSQRAGVDAHLRDCAACRQTVQEIQRLDLVLQDFPPVPNVPFPRFWSKLEGRLPNRTAKRFDFFRPRQLAAGFALAIVASLVGVVALASDETMPDSPLYSVKHLRQDLQLSLTSAPKRPLFELTLGLQRVHEAKIMVQRKRGDLARASLRDSTALIADATPQLGNPGGQRDTAQVDSTLAQLKSELTAVSGAVAQDGPDHGDAAIESAVQDAQNAVTLADSSVDQTGPPVVESPSPEASAAPAPSPVISDAASPTPSPDASATPSEPPAAQPSDTPPAELTPTP